MLSSSINGAGGYTHKLLAFAVDEIKFLEHVSKLGSEVASQKHDETNSAESFLSNEKNG